MWKLTRAEGDFAVDTRSVCNAAYHIGRVRGLRVQTHRDGQDAVYLKFTPLDVPKKK